MDQLRQFDPRSRTAGNGYTPKKIHRVAIAGLGLVGSEVARQLDLGIPGMKLVAVGVRDKAKAEQQLAGLKEMPKIVSIAELEPLADIVVECAPAALISDIVGPFVRNGKKAIVLSCGALLFHPQLIEDAKQGGGQILVPSGALLALDAVSAAAEGKINSVKMVTRKPVRGLVGAPFLEQNKITIDDIKEPMRIFNGTPREAAVGFPANLNVAVALGMAGTGVDQTSLEIWADTTVTRNTHTIEVDSDSARFTMKIENIPSANPKTGLITALSVIAMLRRFESPLRVG